MIRVKRNNTSIGLEKSIKSSLGKRIWDNKLLYLLLLPGLIYYLIFRIIPILGYVIAFKDLAPFEGLEAMFTSPFVGLRHFKDFTSSYYFWNIFNNTVILALWRLLIEFTLPIILAIMINEVIHTKFKKVVQTISYMPYFISNVVLAGIVFMLFSTSGGIIPSIVSFFGGEPGYYVTDPGWFRGILLTSIAWKNIGWCSIIYIAAMSGIDPQLYEAASIDGASKWQQIWKITLPSIGFAIMIMFILRIGVIMNEGWEETLLLYSPAVYNVADIIDTYVYRAGLEDLRYSFATAVNLFKSLIGLMLVWITNIVAKKLGHENMYS
ncbi:ABC transporter permease [Niameybacter massiliensis]|uniref:ABC transporter permease n=1 Tax=Niameybacter massiliensis TaxID=1658108 RepID=UPI0006B495FD|nr:ABC transporter permease subunit [Niameybacter massiliensis]